LKNKIGIMQGRLSPKFRDRFQAHPINYWMDEFYLAKDLGLECIEFIFDLNQWDSNPLMTKRGLDNIKKISNDSKTEVLSVCADFFMEQPIFNKKVRSINYNVLTKLMHNCDYLNIQDIIIPFVDKSSLLEKKDEIKETISFLKEILCNNKCKVNLTLETDLPPLKFIDLIEKIGHEKIKINYDIGNSASLGYNYHNELATYGQFITNIHIKDRILGGGSVRLGEGAAKFSDFFKELKKINFEGIFIIQAFRENDGPNSFKPQFDYIKKILSKNYLN